jgi:hypothetical protein
VLEDEGRGALAFEFFEGFAEGGRGSSDPLRSTTALTWSWHRAGLEVEGVLLVLEVDLLPSMTKHWLPEGPK